MCFLGVKFERLKTDMVFCEDSETHPPIRENRSYRYHPGLCDTLVRGRRNSLLSFSLAVL